MSGTQEPQPAGTGATAAEAAAALAEIQKTQEHVVRAALVPAWYWWAMAPPLVAIGAARDIRGVVVAVTIPLAVVLMAGLTISTIPEVRRRVRVRSAAKPGGRVAAALAGLILLVNGVTIALAVGLTANHVPYPLTIAYGAGAAVLVAGGLALNRYLIRLVLSKAGQPMTDEPETPGQWLGVLDSNRGTP